MAKDRNCGLNSQCIGTFLFLSIALIAVCTSGAQGPASRPIVYVYGFCGSSFDLEQGLLGPVYQELDHELYPSSTVYYAQYNTIHKSIQFSTLEGVGTNIPTLIPIEENLIPSNARFFSIVLYDPVGRSTDPTNVAKVSILNKAYEVSQAIRHITSITHIKDVIVVAHSMGGLDARAYIENLASPGICYDYESNPTKPDYSYPTCKPGSGDAAYAEDVGDLITVDTPHHGTPLASLPLLYTDLEPVLGTFDPSAQCMTEGSTTKSELALEPDGGPGLIEKLNYNGLDLNGQKPHKNTVPIQAIEDFFGNVPVAWTDLNTGLMEGASDDVVLLTSQSASENIPVAETKAIPTDVPVSYYQDDSGIADTEACFVGGPLHLPMLHYMACLDNQPLTQAAIATEIINNDQGTVVWQSPTVVTGTAAVVGVLATLNGTVNPNGTNGRVQFEWGTDDKFKDNPQRSCALPTCSSWIANDETQQFSFQLSPLASSTRYYYRIVAQDTDDDTIHYGKTLDFTTLKIGSTTITPPLVPAFLPVGSASQSLTINGTGFLKTSAVTINGIVHPPAYMSPSQLRITLTAADLATSGNYLVVVRNPAPGGGAASATFNVIPAGSAAAGIIVTGAGIGSGKYSGDGGLATSASLSGPWAMTADAVGNIYIADTDNNVIRKIDTAGVVTTFAGRDGLSGYAGDGGPATRAQIQAPIGVTIDKTGNVYIAEQSKDSVGGFISGARIRKVNQSGTITTVAGGASAICAAATDSLGDGCQAISAIVAGAWGIAIDANSNLYISDYYANRVRRVDASGIITTVGGNGTSGYKGDGGTATDAEMNGPAGISVDQSGTLYVSDSQNNVVRTITSAGTINTIAGDGTLGYSGDSRLATAAQIDFPFGTAIDSLGNLFISELGGSGSAVRKVDTAGIITTVAGVGKVGYSGDGGPATKAMLAFPHGVALDTSGDLFIADSSNNRIREVLALGAPSNLSVTCAPQYAPVGQLVSSFPSSLILNSTFRIADSYNIFYPGLIQSTTDFTSSESANAVFDGYKAYFATNGWTVGGTLIHSNPVFYVVTAVNGSMENQTVVEPTSGGSSVTVTIVIPNNGFVCAD